MILLITRRIEFQHIRQYQTHFYVMNKVEKSVKNYVAFIAKEAVTTKYQDEHHKSNATRPISILLFDGETRTTKI